MDPSDNPIISGTALKVPDNPKLDGLPPRIVTWDSALEELPELTDEYAAAGQEPEVGDGPELD